MARGPFNCAVWSLHVMALTWKRRLQLPRALPASWPPPAGTLAPAQSQGSTQTRSPGNPAQQRECEPVRKDMAITLSMQGSGV